MKVLNTIKLLSEPKFPVVVTCPKCGSELEVEKSDVEYTDGFGTAIVHCPVCASEIELPPEYWIDLTADNITYPINYYRTNSENGAQHVLSDEIDKYVRRGVEYLKQHATQEGNYFYTEFGDCFILIQDYPGDEEYVVTVSQDFNQVWLPYTDEDYKTHDCPINED